ncbi:hypothetical protein [Nocardia sp. NPDC049707]
MDGYFFVELDPTFSSTNREFSKRYNAIDKVEVSDNILVRYVPLDTAN